MDSAKPQKEHQWLQRMLGDWTMDSEAEMAPGEPPVKSSGTEHVRGLGPLWVVGEGRGAMPGSGESCEMLMTLGYDADKQVFVGSWAGSMMTTMFFYSGKLEGDVLTLDTEGPSFAGDGKTARYQDVVTIVSDDERRLHSQALQPDGSWKRFMTATYRRVK